MSELFTFNPSLKQQIAEIERELRYRGFVYPKLIDAKKLNRKAADYQNACLRAAIDTLSKLLPGESDED